MNSILKAAIRASSLKYLPSVAYHARVPVNKVFDATKLQFTRTLWSMWSPRRDNEIGLKVHHSFACGCGCGIQRLHTKGEKELVEFLTEEIAAEKKLQKVKTIPTEVEDFKVELNGSEVTLTKKSGDEKITVFFNVNHTVDAESEPELNPNMDKPEFADMRSKPNFEVDIQRGNRTLGFTCSFNADQTPQEDDVFGIDEVTLYDGEWSEQTYAVAGPGAAPGAAGGRRRGAGRGRLRARARRRRAEARLLPAARRRARVRLQVLRRLRLLRRAEVLQDAVRRQHVHQLRVGAAPAPAPARCDGGRVPGHRLDGVDVQQPLLLRPGVRRGPEVLPAPLRRLLLPARRGAPAARRPRARPRLRPRRRCRLLRSRVLRRGALSALHVVFVFVFFNF